MRSMLAANISFYDIALAPYALLLHSGGAPLWVVDDWITRASKKRRRGRLPTVERLLSSDLLSTSATRKSRREFLRLLNGELARLETGGSEAYE